MHPNPRRIVPVLLLIALAALAIWYFGFRENDGSGGSLSASGTIEAVRIQISPELGGKVVAVHVGEGDAVKAGDVLVELDASLWQAQQAQAAAGLEVAQLDPRRAPGEHGVGQEHVADPANGHEQAAHETRPGVLGQRVGFELPERQKAEPGGFVQRGAERDGPVQQSAAVAQRVLRVEPVLANVHCPVQQQQRVDGPLDHLLVVDRSLLDRGCPLAGVPWLADVVAS